MRLKSIKLAGFKSFVDPTTVSFKSNLTGIVGPNGCGKSNVIDAVRWVMGESSAKYLRGESMTDVIFNGSRNRKPVGQASIELLFDNSEGKLGGAYAQYAEISVKRVVTREAQSSYLLNGSKCRRRDITDLFLGTGLGARSYAIIEQGMISRLIEAKPEELRTYLEEAAGISKYKERRRETENRIRRTQDNLERLEDVREELGRQLERLGRQAEAARRYQQLKASERKFKSELAVLRWREADQRLVGVLEQISNYELQQESCLVQLRQGEARLETSREKQAQATDALDHAQKQLTDTSLQIARLEQGLAHRQQRERQLQQELEELAREEQKSRQALQEDQQERKQLQQQLEDTQPLLEELSEAEELEQEGLDQLEEQLHELDLSWEAFLGRVEQDQSQATLAQARIQQHERSLQSLRQRIQKLDEHQQQLPGSGETEQQLDALELEREALETQLLQLDEQEEATRSNKERFQEELQQLRQTSQQTATQLQQQKGRLASLQALQQAELEGQDAELETWLQQKQLQDWPRLGEWLQVAPGWEKAVETCLQGELAALLSPVPLDANLAQQLVDLPSGDLRLYQQHSDAPPEQKNTSLLSKLQNSASLPASLQQQLNRIEVVDNLSLAWSARNSLQEGESLVTPQGERVFADGLVLQAENARNLGVLARQQELRQLEASAELLEEEQAEQQDREAELQEQLQASEAELQSLLQQRKPLQQQLNDLSSRQASLQTQLDHTLERKSQLQEEQQQLQAEQQELLETLQQDQEVWQEALLKVEENSEARQGQQQHRDGLRHQREHKRQQLKQRQAALQEARIKQQQLMTREVAAGQALERLEQQLAGYESKKEQLQLDLEAATEPGNEQMQQLEELLEIHQQQEDRVQQLRQQQQQAQEEQRLLEQERSQQDRELERLRNLLEQERLQQQGLMVKRDSHLDSLAEQELSLKEVLETLPEEALESRWQHELEDTQARIKRLGAINLAAIEEYDQQYERKSYLDAQHAELTDALQTLDQAIRRIDKETRQRFKATFEQVNQGLQELFPRVFGGGTAWLQLTGDDLLETGVAIMARPPGKKNATIHLLSGGEKALTALALVFSIFELNPAPFCMLDEVDAPLDDANVGRYAKLVRDMSERIQFIYITHNKQAMESADQLMGVTMQEPGVSRLVTVDLDEASAMVAS
ncbi:chromosome segregation protein SMC [Marinospirillum sp.]|uniref:chromosome segregation protein SMC n=1 Tax=Marinospirillum sp. TaxID=2183934 RepID=UPI0028700A8D|nr:chromosome segregation protein SMC [Marinospirillum sp.]MDR9466722.1 chromosome segregation protein SMC [Marinospirillum sp.]